MKLGCELLLNLINQQGCRVNILYTLPDRWIMDKNNVLKLIPGMANSDEDQWEDLVFDQHHQCRGCDKACKLIIHDISASNKAEEEQAVLKLKAENQNKPFAIRNQYGDILFEGCPAFSA